MRLESPAHLEEHREKLFKRPAPVRRLWICGGTGCLAGGGRKVLAALRAEAESRGLTGGSIKFRVDLTGCRGLCELGPLVEVQPEQFFYKKVRPQDAPEIVAESLIEGRPLPGLMADPACPRAEDMPFFKPQTRLLMDRLGRTDPEDIDDYLLTGGFTALGLALGRLGPAHVSALVEQSGLRGRGGGGFPAGVKWRACRLAPGPVKYVAANGDEGDPGAFMNRSLMEGDPLAIVEGLTLGGYAVGAARGFIYVRHEYPLSVDRLARALDSARSLGLLGGNILGSGFDFDLEIVEGGGAFVCGESTALMASIEGREGVPRVKYVRSTERGLWDCPTLLQNVETWANIPHLVNRGPDWFKSLGAPGNPGTKIFSLVGQARRVGLVEMPLGSKLRTLVEEVGGGVRAGRVFKAVQTGGPSGGCLPASALDLPVDFDHLTEAGAMMGSGGLIVMDDLSCMVDVARYFTKFLVGESCGKCAPCREGLPLLAWLLDGLCQGRGRPEDVDGLESAARELAVAALCGLGQSAANPILSTLRYFREEYLEHAGEGYCRAGRCAGLYHPVIDEERCIGCGACLAACPAGAIEGEKKKPHQVRPAACLTCGACLKACRFMALGAERRPAHA